MIKQRKTFVLFSIGQIHDSSFDIVQTEFFIHFFFLEYCILVNFVS